MKYQNNLPALFDSRSNRRVFVSKSLATLAGATATVVPPPPVSRQAFAQAGGQIGPVRMAGSTVHRARPLGERRHGLLSDSDRPGGRGGDAGHGVTCEGAG